MRTIRDHSFRIHSPHIEGSEPASFEEYPRVAHVALESFLADAGIEPSSAAGDRQPFRLRAWHWEFDSTVEFGSTLSVTTDVQAATDEAVRVGHTFRTDGEVRIDGVTEYGCLDRGGEPANFAEAVVAPLRTETSPFGRRECARPVGKAL